MESNQRYDKHIFICTNQRINSDRPSCGEEHGMELVKAFKKEIKDRGLNVDMRAQKTGCMDLCEMGPSVVVYPEGVFYGRVQISDVLEIVEEHLVNGRPVERLRLKFERQPGN
jgi:(2Fe-2S) ferredoxin